MRIEIYLRADKDIGVRLKGKNGKILLASEGYKRMASALKMINLLNTALREQFAMPEGVDGTLPVVNKVPVKAQR